MIVEVDVGTGEVGLADPATFSELHVAARGDGDLDGVVAALGGDACPADRAEHIWIRMDALRRLAAAADPEWEAGFAAMCEFAAGKGWVDPTGECLAAHVVWGES